MLYYNFLIDYYVYLDGLNELLNNNLYKTKSFIYLPSFFIFTPLLLNKEIFFNFLIICFILDILLLVKLKENPIIVIFFGMFLISRLFAGNIDVFIFLIITYCLYKDNEILTTILLAFITFKPTVILILPYFVYYSKNRKRFIIIYSITLILFNIYFLFYPEKILEYIYQGLTFSNDIRVYLCYSWLFYVYYYYFKNKVILPKYF